MQSSHHALSLELASRATVVRIAFGLFHFRPSRRFDVIRDEIVLALREAVDRANVKGTIPLVPVGEVPVEHPQKPEFGDYASTLPLRLSRAASLAL